MFYAQNYPFIWLIVKFLTITDNGWTNGVYVYENNEGANKLSVKPIHVPSIAVSFRLRAYENCTES